MSLAAVVGLVVEEMDERRHERLLDVARVADRAVAQHSGELGVGQAADVALDAPVLRLARAAELLQILEQNRVELRRRLALAGEAAHPDPIGHQEMFERAVHGFEEGAAVGAIIGVGQSRGCVVDSTVRPVVIGREHGEGRMHAVPPCHSGARRRREPGTHKP
jgi:hypothetical protein